ncbi:hypothetical protein FRB96_003786 [Tulasnella sp. 330]|nr:hypothetical protein FRB96_003786 [Tulasnella sp. 330]
MDHLAALLQHQLAGDTSAFEHLPYIISSLTSDHLAASPQTVKWILRVNSLMHSKDPAARWAGICLAKKTSELSPKTMMEHAQTWVTNVLPMLSRTEPVPIYKASTYLLFCIFSSAVQITEFQRQVSLPNISKFASSLLALSDRSTEPDLTILVVNTLSALVVLYPTQLRPVQAAMYKLSLRFLAGSYPSTTSPQVASSSAKLQATLHLTGGKTGGSVLWKKTLDGTLASAQQAVTVLRTTFGEDGVSETHGLDLPTFPEDRMIAIPMALDRLRCMTMTLKELLRVSATRPVIIPMGAFVGLISMLLRGAPDQKEDLPYFDPAQRLLQLALVPETFALGCDLLMSLSECVGRHLTPYTSQMITTLTYHLAHSSGANQAPTRTNILRTIPPLLHHTRPFHGPLSASRLTKAILPSLTRLLPDAPTSSSNEVNGESAATGSSSKGKGKKRSRGYDGDEVFRASKPAAHLNVQQSEEVLTALDAVDALLVSGFLSPAILSLVHKTLLSLLLWLPQRTQESLSPDLGFHGRMLKKLSTMCVDLACDGTSGWASRSIGTVISSVVGGSSAIVESQSTTSNTRRLEQTIHPRLPPLLRSLPPIESLTLFKREETKEERETRETLQIVAPEDDQKKPNYEETTTSPERITTDSGREPLQGAPSSTVVASMPVATTTTISINNDTIPGRTTNVTAETETTLQLGITSFGPISSTAPSVPVQSIGDMEEDITLRAEPPFVVATNAISSSSHGEAFPLSFDADSREDVRPDMDDSDDDDEEIPSIDMRSDTEEE